MSLRLVAATVCLDCGAWPCRCLLSVERVDVASLVRLCACGRNVTVGTSYPSDVTRGVQMHNATPQHMAWRRLVGL